jgi:hypothetical protein
MTAIGSLFDVLLMEVSEPPVPGAYPFPAAGGV